MDSRYVCSEHHNRPVTWRGKGCPDCDKRRADARRRRISRRTGSTE